MMLLIDRKQSVKEHSYHIVHGINNHDEGMTVQGFYQVIDEESAKDPQECEWNRQGAEDFIITGCGHRPYKVIIDNCGFKIDFCPYCGRKIKVVE